MLDALTYEAGASVGFCQAKFGEMQYLSNAMSGCNEATATTLMDAIATAVFVCVGRISVVEHQCATTE